MTLHFINKTFAFVVTVFCVIGMDQALGQNMPFNHITVENGLVNNSVLAITQDEQGFMWFGTRQGLTRYDGVRFKTYKSRTNDSTSISSNDVLSLFVDSKHNLWIGSTTGLDKYDSKRDGFEKISIDGGGNVQCIYEDSKGNFWVGGSSGLHLLTDRAKNNFQTFRASPQGIAGNFVRAIFEDHLGNLWVCTNDGLTKMKWINNHFTFETIRHEPGKSSTLSADYITTIAEDATHRLWIGTQHDGVNLYDPSTQSFSSFVHRNNDPASIVNNNVRKIVVNRKGEIWIGTQEGLSVIDPTTKAIRSYQHDASHKESLSQNSIHSLFQDANGSMWVGTYFGGANVTYSSTTDFTIYQNNGSPASLSNNVVSSIVEDSDHNLWIGTEGGGLNYFNRTTGQFTVFKNKSSDVTSLGSNLVKGVYLDPDGNPWVSTHGGGLNVFDRKNKKFTRYLYKENDPTTLNSEITSMLEDHSSRFWVVTATGLKLFRRNKTSLEPIDIKSEISSRSFIPARTLYEDRQQNLWIGAQPGLYIVRGNTIKKIDSTYSVNCVLEDVKGNIWFGLNYGGLARYDQKNRKLILCDVKLPGSNVVGILDDDEGNLWLSTDNGLIKFHPSTKSVQTYTSSDGLAGNEFNDNSYLKDSRGELFFGGFNGITSFLTNKIGTNQYRAPIAITGLKLFNKNVEINGEDQLLKENINLTKELVFRYNQDVFTIEFALLNFIKSDKNKYTYKLDGFDKEWNEVTSTSATYTSLPSGNYTFWVKGTNNDGVQSEPVSLKIKILPPFWLTWWAYSIYIIAISAIAFLLLRFFFLRALLKKEDELHQIKLNFFTNISHEIRTHLTLILAPVEQLMEQKEKGGFDHQQLSHVKSNANRLLKLVNELMDFRKAETQHLKLNVARHNLIPFLQDIYTSFEELSLQKNIRTSFIHDTEDAPLYFDREQLEKVFFNLLTNAFKFTPAGGKIDLYVEQKENRLVVSVRDNGRGIAPQYLDKLFTNFFQVSDHGNQNTGYGIGLALSKNIVELHKGTITVTSEIASDEKESKTIFTVTLLQGNKHFEGTDFLTSPAETEQEKTREQKIQFAPVPTLPLEEENKNKPFTILVAEDNQELRNLAYNTFIDQYHVLLCENGAKGWGRATEQIPDLIISDVMMPEMDGLTFCTKLKTDERTSHIPVILLTAKSSQSDLVSGLETGADVYLTKPFSTKALELNVRNLLSSREKMRQKFSQHIIEESQHEVATIETVKSTLVNSVDREFLNKVIQFVEKNIDNPDFGVEMLSREVGMSAPILYKKIKAVTDMSVNEFVKSLRLKKASQLLQQKNQAVYEVAYAVGYSDRKYFSKEFKKQFGKTPSEYAGVSEVE